MYILGLHNSYLSGAALFKDDELIGAVSEERFTRVKNFRGIPKNAINYLLEQANVTLKNIDVFCYSMIAGIYPNSNEFESILNDIKETSFFWKDSPSKGFERVESEIKWNKKYLNEYFEWLDLNSIPRAKSFEYDHHYIHACGAIFSSPFVPEEKVCVFTADGKGGFKSSSFNFWDGQKLVVKSFSSSFHSLGYFYGTITKLLGFKSERHEGKVTGLAAHGNPNKLTPLFRKFIKCVNGKIKIMPSHYYLPWFVDTKELPMYEEILKKFSAEDIAAGAQCILEEVVCEWIEFNIQKNSSEPISVCLSGGLFGNVKLNQKIKSLESVKNLFVMPAMGDGGLPLGACLLHKYKNNQNFWITQNTMAVGPNFNSSKFDDLITSDFKVFKPTNLIMEVSKILNENNIVGYFDGSMEFGPRALCNRSIIANARDRNINESLNKRLARSEFMPFAPVTTDQLANLCFKNYSVKDFTLPFMTSTIEVTEKFAELCPAAVHIDNTARPQIVTKDSNPFIYSLISYFYKNYGDLCLINTSFNLHEEPIICSPKDALRALKLNAVDLLLTSDKLIYKNKDLKSFSKKNI